MKYIYSLSSDFGGNINPTNLEDEIEASSIATTLSRISVIQDTVDIHFTSALSGAEETTLNGLIATHDSSPTDDLKVAYVNVYYGGTGGEKITQNETTVTLDTIRTGNPQSIFTLTNSELIVGQLDQEYVFLISYDVAADNDGSARSKLHWWLEMDTGSGFTEVAGTRRGTYHRNSTQGEGSSSATILMALDSGYKLRIRGQRISGGDANPVSNGVSLVVDKRE